MVHRTPIDFPYSYDEYLLWRKDYHKDKSQTVYSDRLFQWDSEKYNKCCEEIFGNHILSKRQFLVWISSRFQRFRYTKDDKFEVKAKTGGILISINNQSRFISMKIINGKIIEAQEIDTPLFYVNKFN